MKRKLSAAALFLVLSGLSFAETPGLREGFETENPLQFYFANAPRIWNEHEAVGKGCLIINEARTGTEKVRSGSKSFLLDVTVDKSAERWGAQNAWTYRGKDLNIKLEGPLFLSAAVFVETLPPGLDIRFGVRFNAMQNNQKISGGLLTFPAVETDENGWKIFRTDITEFLRKRGYRDITLERWFVAIVTPPEGKFTGQRVRLHLDDIEISTGAKTVPVAINPALKELRPASIRQFYLKPGEEGKLEFQVAPETDVPGELTAILSGYEGESKGIQNLKWSEETRSYTISLNLPAGYYEIEIPAADKRFGIFSMPVFAGKPDPFFALELLLNESGVAPDRWDEILTVVRNAGIRMDREYHNFPAEERQQGKRISRYDAFYTALEKHDMKAVWFFSNVPAWSKPAKGGNFPQKLQPLAESLQQMFDARAGGTAAFQIMNETDNLMVPGEACMPLVKLASYVLAAGPHRIPLVSPGFTASSPRLVSYLDNGLLDDVDIFAFHTYESPENMVPRIAAFRNLMAGRPKADIPIWVTESGKAWSNDLVNITNTYGPPFGRERPSVADDRLSALWITMKAVEAKSAGVEAYFPFCMKFFREGIRNYGMTCRNWSPMRSLAAYFQCVRELSGKRYCGDWKEKPEGVKLARVFSGEDGAVCILYADPEVPLKIALSGIDTDSAANADGSSAVPDNRGKYRISGGLIYLRLSREALTKLSLETNTEAMRLLKLAEAYTPVPRRASPVIYQFAWWNVGKMDSMVYHRDSNRVEFVVNNLGGKVVKIAPELTLPPGARILNFPRIPVELAPGTEKTLTWEIDFSVMKEVFPVLRLRDAANAASAAVPLLELRNAKTRELDYRRPERWRANSSGRMTIGYNPNEDAATFRSEFGDVPDKWVFPEFIPEQPRESFSGAVGISFDIKAVQDNGLENFTHPLVMLSFGNRKETGAGYNLKYDSPGKEYRNVFVAIDPVTAENIRLIRIGMCPRADISFQIRNLKVHYAR